MISASISLARLATTSSSLTPRIVAMTVRVSGSGSSRPRSEAICAMYRSSPSRSTICMKIGWRLSGMAMECRSGRSISEGFPACDDRSDHFLDVQRVSSCALRIVLPCVSSGGDPVRAAINRLDSSGDNASSSILMTLPGRSSSSDHGSPDIGLSYDRPHRGDDHQAWNRTMLFEAPAELLRRMVSPLNVLDP